MKAGHSKPVKDDFNKLIAVSSAINSSPTTDAKQESRYGVNGFRRKKKDKDDNVTHEYADGLATAVAKSSSTVTYLKAHQLVGFEKDGDFFYFITDALGSVRDIVGYNSGTSQWEVMQSYDYSENGDKTASTALKSDKAWVGGLSVNDDVGDSGLYLMGHRHYDPSLGRFLSRDPIGFAGGMNLYSYGNSPVTRVDPAGLRDSWSDLSIKDRAKETMAYVFKNHDADIRLASTKTGVPAAAIAAMLAMERRNDALSHGSRDRWRDHWVGDAVGPANINQDAIDELINAGKLPEGTDLSPCPDSTSVKYGAMYLGSKRKWLLDNNDLLGWGVPGSNGGYEIGKEDRLWIKAISAYNALPQKDGVASPFYYSFGGYSEEIVQVYFLAKKQYPKSVK